MDAMTRIEQALSATITRAEGPGCPPKLAAAIRYAVFPGGARVRPRLCLAVAGACGDADPAAADAAAAAIELLHCASLVHDDLPCFDDAPTRRGKPSVHATFGERIAVLTGDALIVLAFYNLAQGVAATPQRFGALLLTMGRSVGMPHGIVAGQAWECESSIVLNDYHRAKTGSLFSAATVAGAIAAGAEPGPWRTFGDRLGLAYQVADDLRDYAADPDDIGKPVGRDAALDRPSAARELGLAGALQQFDQLVTAAMDAIPPCPGQSQLRALIQLEVQRFLPKELSRRAA
jgi:geranylgeranyl diphosphate synthase, type II